MSYPVSVQSIIDRALKKADMFESGYISEDNGERMALFNEAYCELYDLLVTSFGDYYVSEASFNLTTGTFNYSLPADFYKLIGVDYQIGSTPTSYVTLKPYTEMERNGMMGTVGNIPSGVIRLRYVPSPTQYTTGTEIVQGISGWETLLVIIMAIAMKEKEESDTGPLERQLARQMKRIEEASQNRDIGMPGRVNDIYKLTVYQQYASLRYMLTANDIRFLSTEILTPFFVDLV
jgi:hypothetical protein